jgi:transposase-like protein
MGVSRRTFTREFKLAAVRRLEAGVSLAEVSRGLEVNPNVLDRWRREFRQAPGNATVSAAGVRARSQSWSARSASKRSRSIF